MTPLQIRALIARAKKENITLNQNVEKYLNLRILPSGKATWLCKMKIRYKTLNKTLGNYPEVSPVEARRLKNEWVQQMQITPENITPAYTVEDAFNDWAERKKQQVRSFDYMWMRVKNYILPAFGRIQLKDLTAIALIRAWQPLEAEGHIETCRKLCEYVKDMSVFALNTGRVETMHDLTHLKANYPPKKKKHLAAVSPEELPDLFYALERLPRIYGTVWQAMLCQFYTLSRPREIAEMKWEWVDFDNRVIHFPAEIMKTGQPHDVPISVQLEALLRGIPQVHEYVFTTSYTKKVGAPISRESVRLMFTKAGLGGVQTAHGIRSIGSTWLAEQGVQEDVAEMCLAHSTASAVRKAYQRSELLEKRRPVMQAWCDYVDQCRAEAHKRIKDERGSSA